MSIIQSGAPLFASEINYRRNDAIDSLKRADVMIETVEAATGIMNCIADVIAGTRPVQLPMVWSKYPENIWKYNVRPVVTIVPSRADWSADQVVYGRTSVGHCSSVEQITRASVTIYVSCDPCWEAYRRWSSVIIEDFYTAMMAVRNHYNIKWTDISKTQNVSWGEVEFRYLSKDPISVIRQRIPKVDFYGDVIGERETDVRVQFDFTIPNFPEDQKGSANCHVIEEEITTTTTSTRKVKRLRCE